MPSSVLVAQRIDGADRRAVAEVLRRGGLPAGALPPALLAQAVITWPSCQDLGVTTLFLTVGLPGAGKTTRARQLAKEHTALRMTPDEWMIPLFGDPQPEGEARDAGRTAALAGSGGVEAGNELPEPQGAATTLTGPAGEAPGR
jgi:hypothetical protein